MIIPKQYLIGLLNVLSETSSQLKVEYPPLGKLLDIRISEICEITAISREDFKTSRNNALRLYRNDKFLSREIPDHNDLKICMYASSLLNSENKSVLEQELQDESKRNLLKGDKPLFIGYDTNSLRHRSNLLVQNILSSLSLNDSPNIGFCLSEVVKRELRDQWEKKHKKPDIDKLCALHPHATRFLNQHPKTARMARLGAVEYKHLMTQLNCEEIDGSGKGDNAIIQSYEFFRNKRNVDLLLISGDNDFTAMAHEEKIRSVYMKQPYNYETNFECQWEDLVELLYCIAIVFGHIRLAHIDIYGIWTGKNEDDWDDYRISVKTDDPSIFKDLIILEQSSKLPI
ncbi:PIN domain-containing protein [Methanohalophilus sp.]